MRTRSIAQACVCLLFGVGRTAYGAPTAPEPAKVAGIPETVVTAYGNLGADFIVGTIKYVIDANTPVVDRATANTIGAANTRLLEGYNASMRDARYGASQFHSFMNTAIVVGTVGATSSGVAAPVAVPVGIIASKLNDMGRDYLVANAQARASAALSEGLDTLTIEQRTQVDGLLKEGKYQEAAYQFDKHTGTISSMRQALSNDPVAVSLLDSSLNAAMRSGSVIAIQASAAAVTKIDGFKDDFVTYTKQFTAFGKKTDATLARIAAATSDLKVQVDDVRDGIAELGDRQKATAAQVNIIQDVLFEQQPPALKLAMLEGGAKPGLTEKQLSSLKNALKLQVRQQEISATAVTIVSYARDLKTIMGAFGVSDPGLDRAIGYGNAAASALTQAFSGNYLGAVASVAGLFGGGGAPPDPMAEHMKTIMAAFDGVNKRLDEVLKLQIETLKAIESLAYDISAVRREVHSRFDRVDFELATLKLGQQNLIWARLDVCEKAFVNQDAGADVYMPTLPAGRYNKELRRFRSFDALYNYTNSHGDKAYACADELEEVFLGLRNPSDLSGNPLSLEFVESKLGKEAGVPEVPPVEVKKAGNVDIIEYDMPALAYFRSLLHGPSLTALQLGWSRNSSQNTGWGGLANAYSLLARPSATASTLFARVAALQSTSAAAPSSPCQGDRSILGRRLQHYMCSDTSMYAEPKGNAAALAAAETLASTKAAAFLGQPILRDQVGILVNYAMFVASPRDIAKSRNQPGAYTLRELAENMRDPYGRNLLTHALTVVDVSIAQQAMLYGDLTAYFVYEQLWDSKARTFRTAAAAPSQALEFETAKKLLQNANNPWLQRNVLMLILKTVEKSCTDVLKGKTCDANNFAYNIAVDKLFRTTLKGEFAPLTDEAMQVATTTWRLIFDIDSAVQFSVRDVTTGDGARTANSRTAYFSLGGFTLPMPTKAAWSGGELSYPPLVHDRLVDRERLANRLASYGALDSLSAEDKRALFVLLANELPAR